MSKITYPYPYDGLSIKAVHAYHQETLFFTLLFPIIKQEAKRESSIEEGFENIAENWAKQELGVLGFVSTFHMWERQLQELFIEQKGRSDIEIPPLNKGENIVQYGKRVLMSTFDATAKDEHWQELNRARIVVNAFKHGPSKKFDAAMKTYPEFFYDPKDKRHLPTVSISSEQLRQLIQTVATFWEELPRKIDYARKNI
ncbi:hypothetical protein [Methylotenera sp.]|uniref:hypothetical protein n=1 Tax=Methylotenera sp. TaxID=2051956 RepID=UPI0027205DB0|nr:hypothetical protein [Methylotenera sp.]MDO9204148.1 hypothetical protein [Methylotenera sp.]MDP1522345.1 hypothetical protein [Methylotenera sp.]MDP2072581.1 hypothetical protein [Methylotenera sp.]MDP3006050.1 hypothetical protein [Methylotenera sp.]MDP3819165.1 hypothetical protein [Methylotenera sp.]